MSQGFVYILLNPSFHDQVKIGRTTDATENRALHLSRTSGLPTPFIVIYDEIVSDSEIVEHRLHQRFAGYRVSPNREFFRIPVKEAVKALREEARHFQISPLTIPERLEVLPQLQRRFLTVLKPDIVSAAIVQYSDICFLEITRRTSPQHRDEIIERIDLGIIGSPSGPMFPTTRSAEKNAAEFVQLDGYSLIMTTTLFTDEGAQAIADQFEQ